MNTLTLGKSSLQIPRIGLGGAPFGREIDEKTSRGILDYAFDHGVTLIDTAEAYGGGNARLARRRTYNLEDVREVSDEMHSSERIIGSWLRARDCRNQVILCTKFNSGGRREQVKKALQGSLERLQTDHVDIYMLHCWFKDVPIEETFEALTREVQAGRIRTIGCSNFTAAQLQETQRVATENGFTRIDSIQPSFSLADAEARKQLLPYCHEQEIATLTYSPLAAGFLTGKYRPGGDIPKGTRFDVAPAHADVYLNERNFRIVQQLRQLSAEVGQSMIRLALAWVFQHPGVSTMLVGAREQTHLDNALETMRNPIPEEWIGWMNAWLADTR